MHDRADYCLAARLILVEDGKVLLVRHVHPDGRDFWCFPGGGVERGERVADAARREAREELGVEVELLGVVHLQELPERGPLPLLLDLFFLARRTGGQVLLGADPERAGDDPVLREMAWVPLAALPRWNVLPADLAQAVRDGALTRYTPLPLP